MGESQLGIDNEEDHTSSTIPWYRIYAPFPHDGKPERKLPRKLRFPGFPVKQPGAPSCLPGSSHLQPASGRRVNRIRRSTLQPRVARPALPWQPIPPRPPTPPGLRPGLRPIRVPGGRNRAAVHPRSGVGPRVGLISFEWFEGNRDICRGRRRTERKRGAKSLGKPAWRGLYAFRDPLG